MRSFVIVPNSKLFLAGMVALMPTLQHLKNYAVAQEGVPQARAEHLLSVVVRLIPKKVRQPAHLSWDYAALLQTAKSRQGNAQLSPALEAAQNPAERRFVRDCIAIYGEMCEQESAACIAA